MWCWSIIFRSYEVTENGNRAADVSNNRTVLRAERDYQQHNRGNWKEEEESKKNF